MNTNPQAKVVLCYGDSNTHGTKPDGSGRYLSNVRWTGRLQDNLGSDYYVIEEGLGGRTTDLEHLQTEKPARNGLVYFKACLESHNPVDIVIIMLGTNDHKSAYHRTVEETTEVIKQYCQFVGSSRPTSTIILVAPTVLKALDPLESYDSESEQKSSGLVRAVEDVAQDQGVLFYDANQAARAGEDGLHWTEDSHSSFANALTSIVRRAA